MPSLEVQQGQDVAVSSSTIQGLSFLPKSSPKLNQDKTPLAQK